MSATSDKVTGNYLILDTCVCHYWLDKDIEPLISDQISRWASNKFKVAISDVTYLELIDGSYKIKTKEIINLLGNFFTFELSQRVLIGAGKLGSLYYQYDNNFRNSISVADKIIATTSIIQKSYVITSNVRDFPHPFFISVESKNLEYSKGKQNRLLTIDVLKPNYKVIIAKFDQSK